MSFLRGTRLFGLTILAVLILDQLSKAWIIGAFEPGAGWPVPDAGVGRFLRLVHVHNTGVAFGMFQGNNAIFVVVVLLIVAGLVAYQHRLPPDERWLSVALGLQVGGALGNLVDRLRWGHVTDFLDVRWEGVFHWPTFNVADTCVFIGVCMLAWRLWEQDRHRPATAEPPVLAAAADEAGE